jgi:hypothetical protein
MRRLREAAMVPVFRLNQPSDWSPNYEVSFAEALAMIGNGMAVTINQGTAIRLCMMDRDPEAAETERPWNMRDRSCKVNEKVLIDFADGRPHARSIIVGWAENHAGIGAVPSGVA